MGICGRNPDSYGGDMVTISQGKRHHAVPSLTVGVRSEIRRAARKLIPSPDCEGGVMLTIWLRQAASGLSQRYRYRRADREIPALADRVIPKKAAS
jgi:hypothetical protein